MGASSLGPANLHFDDNRWRVRASTVLGASHERRGTPCQDAFAAWSEGRRCVAVVADGAGSAPKGGQGAILAARVIMARLAGRAHPGPARLAIRAAMADARAALSDEAALSGDKLDHYATTIIGVLMQGSHGLFFHLGDGLALAFDRAAPPRVRAISRGTPGEFANVSSFLSQSDWAQNLVFTPVRCATSTMLMSDGFSPFATGPDGQPKPRFYEPILEFMESNPGDVGSQALADMMSEEVVRRTSGDDCTLLWASRVDE